MVKKPKTTNGPKKRLFKTLPAAKTAGRKIWKKTGKKPQIFRVSSFAFGKEGYFVGTKKQASRRLFLASFKK